MTGLPTVPSQPNLTWAIRWSVVLHSTLAVALLVGRFVVPTDRIVILPSLRVDLVGLPDVLKKDLSKMDLSQPPAETALPSRKARSADEVGLKNSSQADKVRRERMKNAMDRIKALNKIQEAAPIKGNKISKGSSVTGDAKESIERTYYDDLHARLQRFWSLPVWLERQNLSAQVTVTIDSQGRVIGYNFVKRSGHSRFDQEVARTIESAQPLPAPPAELLRTLRRQGIVLGFPL